MFDTDVDQQPVRDLIPDGLDEIAPGPYLAAILEGLDRPRLSGFDLVSVLRAEARMASHYQALSFQSMNEVSHRTDPEFGFSEEAYQFASDEIRAALTLTRRAAEVELGLAIDLCERLPEVWRALCSGDIDVRRARVIAYGTSHLPLEAAREVVDRVMKAAPGMTTGELGSLIRRLCIDADPEETKARYDRALEERRVHSELNIDGTANLMGLQLPIDRVSVANRRVNAIARGLKTKQESRSLDQIRADVLLDLLCGVEGKHSSQRGNVDIHVELTTLFGLDDRAGEIPGMGPVIADIARQVVAAQHDGEWSYTVTDQGRPVATGTTRRRPTSSQKRQLEARYRTCVFPGCRMPATDCDLDHRESWAGGGATTTDNLGPLCRHDHILKHAGWKVHRLPDGGHRIASPLGHAYLTGRARSP